MKENGEISLSFQTFSDKMSSLAKINGFTGIDVTNGVLRAKKPVWQSSGALLNRKPKENGAVKASNGANPWANLKKEESKQVSIDDDQLMKDE